MNKKTFQYILAYLMWFVFTLLGILFILVSRNGLTGLLNQYFIRPDLPHDFDRRMQVNLIDRVYFLALAVILLILVIVVEEYFKRGISQGKLFKRFSKVIGIEVLLLFVASLMTAYLIGFSPLLWLVLGGELLLGGLLLWFGVKKSGIVKTDGIENLPQ